MTPSGPRPGCLRNQAGPDGSFLGRPGGALFSADPESVTPGGGEDSSSCSTRGGTEVPVPVTWPEPGPWRRWPGLSGWLPGCSRASSAGCPGTAPPGCCPGLRPQTGRLKQKGGALPTDFLSAADREDGCPSHLVQLNRLKEAVVTATPASTQHVSTESGRDKGGVFESSKVTAIKVVQKVPGTSRTSPNLLPPSLLRSQVT